MPLKLSEIDQGEIQADKPQDLKLSNIVQKEVQAIKQDDKFVHPEEMSKISKDTDTGQAFIEGYGQAATAGYLPQLQALSEPITDRLFNLITGDDVEAAPWSQMIAKGPEYVKSRDVNIKRQERLKKDDPIAYYGGMGTGFATLGALTGPSGGTMKMLTPTGKLVVASGLGAAYGLLSNPGDVEGIVNELQVSPRLKNTLVGTLTGFGAQVGIDKIVKYSKPLAQKITRIAYDRAAKSMGYQKHLAKQFTEEQIEAAGKFALDEDILSGSARKMAKRTQKSLEKAGGQMEDVFSQIDEAGASKFNPLDAATSVDEQLGGFWRDPLNRAQAKQFENTLETIMNRGADNIPLKEAQSLKKLLGKAANWKNATNVSDKERIAREAYGIVNKQLDVAVKEGAEKIGSKQLSSVLKNAKGAYSAGKTAEKLLENKIAMGGNRFVSLSDFIVGTGAASTMGPSGLLVVAGKKIAEKYGNQTAAKLLNNLGKAVNNTPKLTNLLDKNPVAFQALVYKSASNLMNKKGFDVNKHDYKKELKGRDRWVATGLDKISDKIDLDNPETVKKLLFSKKGENLLANASGLKENSKAMNNLINKIKDHIGE